MRWLYSYMFTGPARGSYSPLTESGPPFEHLTIDADDSDDAARQAKELYPQHIANDRARAEANGREYFSLVGDQEPDMIMLSRADVDDANGIVEAFMAMQPVVYNYATLERQMSAVEIARGMAL